MKGWIIPIIIAGAFLVAGMEHISNYLQDANQPEKEVVSQQTVPLTPKPIEQMTPDEMMDETERLLEKMIEMQTEINELQRQINETEELMLKFKTGKAWSA
jgi:hypothetical protein